MPKYYFTYGTSNNYPYQNGWTEVVAMNERDAIAKFRSVHPDRSDGIINCSWIYTEEKFKQTLMFTKGNLGAKCHEVI